MPSSPSRGSEVLRRRLVTAAKVVVTIALLAFVLRKIPLGDLGKRLASLSALDVTLLAAITTFQTALVAVRWWRLLHGVGERVPYRAVFGDVCVGILYSSLLPGGVGGDVIRALRARARVGVPSHAWSTSIYERIIGLFVMALGASIAVGLGLADSLDLPRWFTWLAFGLTLALAGVLVFASLPFRLARRVIGARLPAAAAADLQGIGEDLEGPLARLAVRAEAFAWSVLYQAVNLAFFVAGAAALGAPGHARAIVVGVPIIIVLSLLPVTIGGHGLREGLYVGVLGALGLPGDVALGLSALFLGSVVAFSVAGAVVSVAGKTPGTGAKDPPSS